MINYQSKFSHIYVEDQVRDLALSKLVLKKFKNSEIIQIRHYKDIFNRTNQDFQVQKRTMKLILAKKTGPLCTQLLIWFRIIKIRIVFTILRL